MKKGSLKYKPITDPNNIPWSISDSEIDSILRVGAWGFDEPQDTQSVAMLLGKETLMLNEVMI